MKKSEKKIITKLKASDKSTEEKIIMSYIKNQGDVPQLTEQEQFVDDVAREIFSLMVKCKPKNWIKNWILRSYPEVSISYAYKLIDMTERIYGNSYKVSQEMAKAIYIHEAQKIKKLALDSGNLELAEKCAKEIAIMQGAKDEVKDEIPMIPAVIISTNDEFIRPKEIDIDHEEIKSDDH
jgi:hypothetical protein